jgi:hypothetical protein
MWGKAVLLLRYQTAGMVNLFRKLHFFEHLEGSCAMLSGPITGQGLSPRPQRVQLRKGVWQHRVMVPRHLRAIIGKREFTESLGTAKLAEASGKRHPCQVATKEVASARNKPSFNKNVDEDTETRT